MRIACDSAGRGLPTMAQLDRFAGISIALSPGGRVDLQRLSEGGQRIRTRLDQLEAVVLTGGGAATYERVNLAVQHAFRCVALPSN